MRGDGDECVLDLVVDQTEFDSKIPDCVDGIQKLKVLVVVEASIVVATNPKKNHYCCLCGVLNAQGHDLSYFPSLRRCLNSLSEHVKEKEVVEVVVAAEVACR